MNCVISSILLCAYCVAACLGMKDRISLHTHGTFLMAQLSEVVLLGHNFLWRKRYRASTSCFLYHCSGIFITDCFLMYVNMVNSHQNCCSSLIYMEGWIFLLLLCCVKKKIDWTWSRCYQCLTWEAFLI